MIHSLLILRSPNFDDALATTLLDTNVRDPNHGDPRPTHHSSLRRRLSEVETVVSVGASRRSPVGALRSAAQSDLATRDILAAPATHGRAAD